MSDKHTLQGLKKMEWTGSPATGLMLRPSDSLLIPFALLMLAITVVQTYLIVSWGIYLVLLFVLPFWVLVWYLLVYRFILDVRRRKDTIYSISEDALIVQSSGSKSTLKLCDIKSLHLIRHKYGLGTILINPVGFVPFVFQFSNIGLMNDGRYILEFIDSPDVVYELLSTKSCMLREG